MEITTQVSLWTIIVSCFTFLIPIAWALINNHFEVKSLKNKFSTLEKAVNKRLITDKSFMEKLKSNETKVVKDSVIVEALVSGKIKIIDEEEK